MYRFDTNGQMTMLGLDTAERGGAPPKRRPGKPDSELVSIPYFHLDLLSSPVDLFGQRHWELRSPWREGKRPLNTGAAPRRPIRVSLSGILEAYPSLKYYLSKTACLGILRRAFERGKKLPKMLARALKIQAGLMRPDGQLTNMQMQTFVTQPNGAAEGFDGYSGVMAFAANQRDEVRDLHDVAGVLGAQPGMKQQTFVAGFLPEQVPALAALDTTNQLLQPSRAAPAGTVCRLFYASMTKVDRSWRVAKILPAPSGRRSADTSLWSCAQQPPKFMRIMELTAVTPAPTR